MTIYQLHEYSGEWEDFRDYIIGSYLKRERAEEEKIKVEAKEKELIEHYEKCSNCPYWNEDFNDVNALRSACSDYCSEADFDEHSNDVVYCKNYFIHHDEAHFEIKEVEVEE